MDCHPQDIRLPHQDNLTAQQPQDLLGFQKGPHQLLQEENDTYRNWKKTTSLTTYYHVEPGEAIPCIYGLPKRHKEVDQLRTIVSSINSVTYNMANTSPHTTSRIP